MFGGPRWWPCALHPGVVTLLGGWRNSTRVGARRWVGSPSHVGTAQSSPVLTLNTPPTPNLPKASGDRTARDGLCLWPPGFS